MSGLLRLSPNLRQRFGVSQSGLVLLFWARRQWVLQQHYVVSKEKGKQRSETAMMGCLNERVESLFRRTQGQMYCT